MVNVGESLRGGGGGLVYFPQQQEKENTSVKHSQVRTDGYEGALSCRIVLPPPLIQFSNMQVSKYLVIYS